ncbi:MAG: protein translocase subunit SecF [Nocardioidaceae bacterium]
MSKLGQVGARLYRGDVSVDFVGRRKLWYLMSLAIVVVAVAALVVRGLNFGIEFRGGVEFNAKVANPSAEVKPITDAVAGTGIKAAANPVVVTSGTNFVRIDTEPLSLDESFVVKNAVQKVGATEVSSDLIGPTWGAAVAKKALTGLLVFLVLVLLFIWAYFREWRMSAAAIVALAHDLVITVGIYALTGFEVTPATVTGFLTILGYSLYDTVVVFDKVRENTRGIVTSTRLTYADSANLAVNQTLVRSINTSIAALLPVGAILYVGVFQLGSGPLKDLALALFVGMAAGTYSSIFIATPLLAQLKMLEPAMQAQAKRVANRRSHAETDAGAATPAGRSQSSAPVPDAVTASVASTSVGASQLAPTQPSTAPTQPSTAPAGSTAAATSASAGREPRRVEREPRPVTREPRPMSAAAAKRAQPQRQARSKRGKKR